MTRQTSKYAGLLVTTLAVSACSNSYTYDYGNNQSVNANACSAGTEVYAPIQCGVVSGQAGYSGQQQNFGGAYSPQQTTPVLYPHSYASADDTVLRGSAPYGAAINNTPYVSTHGYARDAGGYFNLGAVSYDMDSNLYGVQGRIGYNANPYLGGEIEASVGTTKDAIGTTLDGVDYSVAGFAIAQIPYTKHLTLLARAGYHTTRYEGPADATLDTNGFAYGVGAELALTRKDSLRVDYTRYQSNALKDNDSLSVAYAHKF